VFLELKPSLGTLMVQILESWIIFRSRKTTGPKQHCQNWGLV